MRTNGNIKTVRTRRIAPALIKARIFKILVPKIRVIGRLASIRILLFLDSYQFVYNDTLSLHSQPMRVSRTGYEERDLGQNNARIFRGDIAIHYRFKPGYELIARSRWSLLDMLYQETVVFSRTQLKNHRLDFQQIELKTPSGFVRLSSTGDFLGDSYYLFALAPALTAAAKNDDLWNKQFSLAFSDNPFFQSLFQQVFQTAGRPAPSLQNAINARAYADANNQALYPYFYNALIGRGFDADVAAEMAGDFTGGESKILPGSNRFNEARDRAGQTPFPQDNGTGLRLGIRTYMLEGQKDLTRLTSAVALSVGGQARVYHVYQNPGIVYQPQSGRDLLVGELGLFIQGIKTFFDDRLRFTAALRLDKHQNFDAQFSPRLSLVWSVDKEKNHVLRAIFSTGFRAPTILEQYQILAYGPSYGSTRELGGTEDIIRQYNLNGYNTYTTPSLNLFDAQIKAGKSVEEAASVLKRFTPRPIQPEKVLQWEAGYRYKWKDKFIADFAGYFNLYRDMIYFRYFAGPGDDGPQNGYSLTPQQAADGDYRDYSLFANVSQSVKAAGFNAALGYNLTNKISISSAYSYFYFNFPRDEETPDVLINFALPKHTARVALAGANLFERFGFNITYNWRDAYHTENEIDLPATSPAYSTLDAQISLRLPSLWSTLKIGATNITQNNIRQTPNSPPVGSVYYAQWTIDTYLLKPANK